MTYTFHAFAGELAGEFRHYAAMEYMTDAAAKIPTVSAAATQPRPRLIQIDLKQEADEASAGVQMLRKFSLLARIAAEQAEEDCPWNPDEMRSVVFGDTARGTS